MNCGVVCSSDPMLLWLWYRLAAVAPIGPLAWELPYAIVAALKDQKKKKKKRERERKKIYLEARFMEAFEKAKVFVDTGIFLEFPLWPSRNKPDWYP